MGYKVLYRKYRPVDFNNVVGQDYTVNMLKNVIITGKNAHAYIFTGPRGTGKTSCAKIFAKALNCEHPIDGNPCNECSSCLSFNESPDVIEIDAASNNGVDEIRELINNVKLVPSYSKYKVYIIDEVHMLSTSAFNALLLTLEEPPSHVVFILATTDIQNVPITILSRCQRFDFKPVDILSIINRLKYVCDEEKIDATEDALREIALISAGGMRDSLGMLDQLSSDGEKITLEVVSSYFGSISVKKINELLTAIENNNASKLVEILDNLKDSGINYSVFIEKMIVELRKCAIDLKTGNDTHNFLYDDIYNMIFDLNECLCNININVNPYILIEVVLLKYIHEGTVGNKSKDLGNNSDYNPGNKIEEKVEEKNSLVEQKENEIVENEIVSASQKNTGCFIDLNIRINNCFVEASKTIKNEISKSWVDFMNFLMNKDRSLISLVADTVILAASGKYILIQSKIDSTNDLINEKIDQLERFYQEFSGSEYRFASINKELWKKETEKYRFNLKNKIKYNYMEENLNLKKDVLISNDSNHDDLEQVAKEIFGSYEIE